MQLRDSFVEIYDALHPRICDEIIGIIIDEKEGVAGKIGSDGTTDKKRRDSFVRWYDESWLYNLMIPNVKFANSFAGWDFDWETAEPMQFTSYANDQYYHWHYDGSSDRSGLDKNNKIRKLSAILFLNNAYSGGELEMSVLDGGAKKRIFKPSSKVGKGSMVVFPSFITHRITPVTHGVRYSIVLWCRGPQFK